MIGIIMNLDILIMLTFIYYSLSNKNLLK